MLLLQLTIDGLASGALYALTAVGFAIIYNGTRILHMAHGAVFTFGGYAFYICVQKLGAPLPVAVIVALLAAAAFGVLIDILVYRPLRAKKSSEAALFVASIGTLTFCQGVFALIFTTDTLYLRQGPLKTYEIGDITLTIVHIIAAIIALIVFPALQLFLTRTRYGRAIRALADNPRLAVVRGVDVNRLTMLIFAIGSLLAGFAVVLIAWDLGVRPEMGFPVLFVSLVAVIVGGVGYLPGAAAGGFLLGLTQNLSLWQLSGRWQDVVVFGALLIFLVFRPQGLFGHMLATRRV
jgi:branched-chain amino acid transport system permease protein